jgi:hypothetical protein
VVVTCTTFRIVIYHFINTDRTEATLYVSRYHQGGPSSASSDAELFRLRRERVDFDRDVGLKQAVALANLMRSVGGSLRT